MEIMTLDERYVALKARVIERKKEFGAFIKMLETRYPDK